MLFPVCIRKEGLAQWMTADQGCSVILGDTPTLMYFIVTQSLCLTDGHPSTLQLRLLELRKSGQDPRAKHGRQGCIPSRSQSRL